MKIKITAKSEKCENALIDLKAKGKEAGTTLILSMNPNVNLCIIFHKILDKFIPSSIMKTVVKGMEEQTRAQLARLKLKPEEYTLEVIL